MKIKFKKTNKEAFTPEYAHSGDAGLDLRAVDAGYYSHDYNYREFNTGIAFEIPEGHVGLVFPRSSISETSHSLCNSVAVIDSGYRGPIRVRFRCTEGREDQEYTYGDKIAQFMIIPYPSLELEETQKLSNTDRGEGGFGSTGK